MDAGTFDQSPDTGAQLTAESFDTVLDENAVFTQQRHDIRDRSQCDIVKNLFEIGLETAEIVLSAVLDEGMGELEGGTGTGKELQVFQFRVNFGVDDRQSFGQFAAGFVVVGNDDVDTHFDRVLHRFTTGDTAVNGDEHAALAEHFQSFFQRFRGEAVTVIKTVRNKGVDHRAVLTQNQSQQCTCSDTVGIVVAVNEDGFAVSDRLPQAGRSVLDTGEAVGVAQVGKAGVDEIAHLVNADSAGSEKDCDRSRERKFLLYEIDIAIQKVSGQFPIFSVHCSFSILCYTHAYKIPQ